MNVLRFFPVLLLGTGPLWAQLAPQSLAPLIASVLENPRVLSLGWSPDDSWAAIVPRDSGARGGTLLDLFMLDAVEDDVVLEQELWDEGYPQNDAERARMARTMAQGGDSQIFRDTFAVLKFVPAAASAREQQNFPLEFRGAAFTAEAKVTVVEESGEFESKTLDYQIVVTSDKAGSKTISSGRLETAYGVTVLGYFLNPASPRMVVVWQTSEAAFEGETRNTLRFSGCRLTSGFRR